MHPKYHDTVHRLGAWCQEESAIQCALIHGSQARNEFEGDEWSDLDVLLLVDDPRALLDSDSWLASLGETICVVVEETRLDWIHLTWAVKRVLFADSRAVDFSIMPYDRVDDVLSLNAEVHAHGCDIIHDQTGALASRIDARSPGANPAQDSYGGRFTQDGR
jgi:predicted nucleotidyltransferase